MKQDEPRRRRKRLIEDSRAATAIEYALIAGIICLAVVGGATVLGQSANASYVNVKEQVWGP